MKKVETKKFGLITTISMIIGIVIGSGIFFKTPEIIKASQGNILLGALAFVIAAISIIFGGLTIANYTANDEGVGGIISYCETAYNKRVGYLAGWFQIIIYYPAITAVVAWVGASYTLGLFGMDNLLTNGSFNPMVWPVTFGYLVLFFFLNAFKTLYAGKLQSILMYVKVCALIIFAFLGFIYGQPESIITNFSAYPVSSSGVLLALVAVVYAFDGWVIAPSIAHEIKDSKRNLTKALVIAPLIVTVIYLLYYFGLASLQDVSVILSGQDPLGILANTLFGDIGMKVVYMAVVLSILGTLNGVILGYIRLPYALAIRNELPGSKYIAVIDAKTGVPLMSVIFAFCMACVMLTLHFLSLDGAILYGFTIFKGMEIDNLPIVANYFFLILLYLPFIFKRIKASSFLNQTVYPCIATLGALIVIFAGLTKPNFNLYLIISVIIILAGLLIRPKKYD